jgi:hypothetical protein
VTVAAARAELVAKLSTLPEVGGRIHSFAPDSVTPPTAFIGTMTYNRHASFDAADLTAQVWLVVSRAASSVRAAETVDTYIDGANSIPAALEASTAVWDSLSVTGVEFPITVEIGSGQYLAARFDCEVYL